MLEYLTQRVGKPLGLACLCGKQYDTLDAPCQSFPHELGRELHSPAHEEVTYNKALSNASQVLLIFITESNWQRHVPYGEKLLVEVQSQDLDSEAKKRTIDASTNRKSV